MVELGKAGFNAGELAFFAFNRLNLGQGSA
jgi:hypothetical protein